MFLDVTVDSDNALPMGVLSCDIPTDLVVVTEQMTWFALCHA